MISPETLSVAVESGVVTPAQAQRLLELERVREQGGAEPVDDERLRFISGFGDVFVTLGLLLFLSASGYFLSSYGSGLALSLGLAVLSWLLAEFFSRIRRMALPSIVLLITFAIAVYCATLILLGSNGLPWPRYDGRSLFDDGPVYIIAAGLVTAAATALHYARFAVPITVAAGTGALAAAALGLVAFIAPSLTARWLSVIVLLIGLAVFALAMRFDLSDPERVTRRTDIAFWLHLLAAPMIVHPLVNGMLKGVPMTEVSAAVIILLVFGLLGIVAVLIDRRALLVSGLAYAGIAFGSLLRNAGMSYGTIAPATMLTLGAFVLLLSAGWRPLRTLALSLVSPSLAARLPKSTDHNRS